MEDSFESYNPNEQRSSCSALFPNNIGIQSRIIALFSVPRFRFRLKTLPKGFQEASSFIVKALLRIVALQGGRKRTTYHRHTYFRQVAWYHPSAASKSNRCLSRNPDFIGRCSVEIQWQCSVGIRGATSQTHPCDLDLRWAVYVWYDLQESIDIHIRTRLVEIDKCSILYRNLL